MSGEFPGAAALLDEIRESPTAFEFYQLVRILTRLHPYRGRVGTWADPAQEVARFAASVSLAFPAGEVQEFALPEEGIRPGVAPPKMTVNFFGLTGPQGVMPHIYTEHAKARTMARDTAMRDFLDIFNHRAISLLYRAWEKSRATVAHESGTEDRFLSHLLDLVGMGTEGMHDRLPVRDEAAAYFAGLLASRARPADGLARLISDYFDVPASVEQFVGDWRPLDRGGQCELGDESGAGQLGFGVIGDAGWDPQARVRLRLGPLTRAQFDSFLKGGSAHAALVSLAQLYTDDVCGVDAQLVLSRSEVSSCVLGGATPADGAARSPGLGRGTWLASRPLARDPDETTLRLC